jgi:hypothetical protein
VQFSIDGFGLRIWFPSSERAQFNIETPFKQVSQGLSAEAGIRGLSEAIPRTGSGRRRKAARAKKSESK